jgi:hypothetical protein
MIILSLLLLIVVAASIWLGYELGYARAIKRFTALFQ